jgi:hypothetical protein
MRADENFYGFELIFLLNKLLTFIVEPSAASRYYTSNLQAVNTDFFQAKWAEIC